MNVRGDRPTSLGRILFSPGGDQVASISYMDPRIRLYDSVTETLRYTLVGHLYGVQVMVFSHDGKQSASARAYEYGIREQEHKAKV